MNFFQQFAATGNADITLRIMQKGDELTINVMPGSSKSITKPGFIYKYHTGGIWLQPYMETV